MKETELKVPYNPTNYPDSYGPDRPQSVDHNEPEAAIDKLFSFNRQAFGSPLEPEGKDNERRKGELELEEKAQDCEPMDESDGTK